MTVDVLSCAVCIQVACKRRDASMARQDDAKQAKHGGRGRRHEPEDIEPSGTGSLDMSKGDSDGARHPLRLVLSIQCDIMKMTITIRMHRLRVPGPSAASHRPRPHA